jgi:hypothetical protein
MLPAIAGFKFKACENFNHPDEIGTSIHTLSILRIALKVSATLHSVSLRAKFEPDTEIGQKGAFCKGLTAWATTTTLLPPVLGLIVESTSLSAPFLIVGPFVAISSMLLLKCSRRDLQSALERKILNPISK